MAPCLMLACHNKRKELEMPYEEGCVPGNGFLQVSVPIGLRSPHLPIMQKDFKGTAGSRGALKRFSSNMKTMLISGLFQKIP